MNLLFWKKKKPADEESGEDPRGAPDDKTMIAEPEDEGTASQTSLFARLRTKLTAVGQRFRKRRDAAASEDESPDADEPPRRKASAEEPEETEQETSPAARSKKRLLIFGALGVLVLLVTGGGFAAWKWLRPSTPLPVKTAAPHLQETKKIEVRAVPSGPAHIPADTTPPQPEAISPQTAAKTQATVASQANPDIQAQIEALKKQNQEMQAQIEALKKQDEQQPPGYVSAGKPTKTGASSLHQGGVLIINGKDTKASAQSLKQAIEEMNATEGRDSRK